MAENPNNKKVTRATEAEVRREMVDALRHFAVKVPARDTQGNSMTVTEHVMAHRHAIGVHGVLMFMTDTREGTYVRRMFRFWKDVEEIVAPDGGRSVIGKAN